MGKGCRYATVLRAMVAALTAMAAGPAMATDYDGLFYPVLIVFSLVVLFATVTCFVLVGAISRPVVRALVPATIFGPLLALPVVAVFDQAQSWLGWVGISAAIAAPLWGLTWFFFAKIHPRFREIEREAREWKHAAVEDEPDRPDARPEDET
ncbi:hypothetical protein SAMN05421681_101671 [Lysobacter enzymogenes]|nr:hypothetical protein SAMN05421681_101671 [Lysobacter enzymogenes]